MPKPPVSLASRIAELELAVDAGWVSYRAVEVRGFDTQRFADKQYNRVNLLLEYLLPLYDERNVYGEEGWQGDDCDTELPRPKCPTACEDDCAEQCHELHQFPGARHHEPTHCPSRSDGH